MDIFTLSWTAVATVDSLSGYQGTLFVHERVTIMILAYISINKWHTIHFPISLCKLSLTPFAITWLKQTFTEADKNGDGSLSISEVLQLLHKLNVNLPRQKVKQMFKVLSGISYVFTLCYY